MVGDVVDPLDAVFFCPGISEVISEVSPIVRLNPLWGAVSPQDSLFKAQDGVPGGGVGHWMSFEPSSGCFHHCEHVALALAGLWQCDVVDLPGLSILLFHPSIFIPLGLHPFGLFDRSTRLTSVDDLCDGVNGEVHPSISSPPGCCISALVARGLLGPPGYEQFTFTLPVQVHLSHLDLSSLPAPLLWLFGALPLPVSLAWPFKALRLPAPLLWLFISPLFFRGLSGLFPVSFRGLLVLFPSLSVAFQHSSHSPSMAFLGSSPPRSSSVGFRGYSPPYSLSVAFQVSSHSPSMAFRAFPLPAPLPWPFGALPTLLPWPFGAFRLSAPLRCLSGLFPLTFCGLSGLFPHSFRGLSVLFPSLSVVFQVSSHSPSMAFRAFPLPAPLSWPFGALPLPRCYLSVLFPLTFYGFFGVFPSLLLCVAFQGSSHLPSVAFRCPSPPSLLPFTALPTHLLWPSWALPT